MKLLSYGLSLSLLVPGTLAAQQAQEKPSLEVRATQWLELMRAEKFDSAAAAMSPVAKERGVNADQLRQIWPQILERYGALSKATPSNRLQQNGFETVQLLGYFEKGVQNVRVSFDAEGRVAGFFITGPGGGEPTGWHDRVSKPA